MKDKGAEQGLILTGVSGFYRLRADNGDLVTCKARGLFRKQGQTPWPGDRAEFLRREGEQSVLTALLPRRNLFRRPPCANVDILLMIASETLPRTDPYLIDRMAAAAVYRDVSPILLVNKCDLSDETRLRELYQGASFPVLLVSALTGAGMDGLPPLLEGKTTVLCGNSGVGKSAILQYLDPLGSHKTGEVSEKLGRGRHTTRHVEFYSLPNRVMIADTPGFAALDGADGIPAEDLASCFPEFAPYAGECRYTGCLHRSDQGCALRSAVEEGKVHQSRYDSYLRMLEIARQVRNY